MTLPSDQSLDDLRGVKFQAADSKLKKRYSVERSVVDVEASKQENDLIKLKLGVQMCGVNVLLASVMASATCKGYKK